MCVCVCVRLRVIDKHTKNETKEIQEMMPK